MKKHMLLAAAALLLPYLSWTQTSATRADKAYEVFNFKAAIQEYENKEKLNTAEQRRLATCYVKMNMLEKANSVYEQIFDAEDKTAEDVWSYAQVLLQRKDYDKAKSAMRTMAKMAPDDSRVKKYLADQSLIARLSKESGKFALINLSINSEKQDFGTVYYKNQIVFASSRANTGMVSRTWNGNQQPFLNLYTAPLDANQKLMEARLLENNSINRKFHDGPVTFTPDGNMAIFTRNNYDAQSTHGIKKLQLFVVLIKNGKWMEPVAFPYNNNEFSTGHASYDANNQYLYFSSDRPGGKGGVDIYRCRHLGGNKWAAPENVAEVNTEGNELFPYYHSGGYLFFASDGWPGLGGLDVMLSKMNGLQPGRVDNLGSPVNSERDDFAFLLSEDQKTGFVSSNRPGGKGDDDIYAVQVLKPLTVTKLLKGVVVDESSKPIPGALLEIKDEQGKLLTTITVDEQGSFQYEIQDTGTYTVFSVTPGKNPAEKKLTVTDASPVQSCNIVLEKIPDWALAGVITDMEGKTLDGVTVKIKDLKSGFFRKFTTNEKGEFLNILKNVKLNDQIRFELKLEKSGFLSKTVQYQTVLAKQGKQIVNESLDLSLSKLEAGMDLATMLQLKPIFFDKGKYNIRTDAAVELDKIVSILNEYPNMEIELGSHTDCRGSAQSNATLSAKRAEASATYIKKRISNPERISSKGYGESQLVNGCACEGAVKSTCPEEVHQENRRTAFKIISVE